MSTLITGPQLLVLPIALPGSPLLHWLLNCATDCEESIYAAIQDNPSSNEQSEQQVRCMVECTIRAEHNEGEIMKMSMKQCPDWQKCSYIAISFVGS
jgi:hypothetical protein